MMDHATQPGFPVSRRKAVGGALAFAGLASLPFASTGVAARFEQGHLEMSFIITNDGTHIFYKDWGPKDAQPIVFHHG